MLKSFNSVCREGIQLLPRIVDTAPCIKEPVQDVLRPCVRQHIFEVFFDLARVLVLGHEQQKLLFIGLDSGEVGCLRVVRSECTELVLLEPHMLRQVPDAGVELREEMVDAARGAEGADDHHELRDQLRSV